MKKNNSSLKLAAYVFYGITILLIILFIILVIVTYFGHRELVSDPPSLVNSYSSILKRLCKEFLLPALLSAVLGFVLQKTSSK